MNPHLLGLVLTLASAAAIIGVLIAAGWKRESEHIARAQRDAKFGDDTETAIRQALATVHEPGHWDWDTLSPSTERAIAQALGVVRDPITLVGLVQPQRREGGA